MLELATDLGFLDEAPCHVGVSGVDIQEDLERDVTAELDIVRTDYGADAAARDLARDLVAADLAREFRLERSLDAHHRGVLVARASFDERHARQRAERFAKALEDALEGAIDRRVAERAVQTGFGGAGVVARVRRLGRVLL